MGNRKIIILHRSAIVQKGLAELLLHCCNMPVSQAITDYSAVKIAFHLKKTIFFIDSELFKDNTIKLADFLNHGNSVFLIVGNSDENQPEIPADGVIYINDSLEAIQKKLNAVFPPQPKNTVEPGELTQRETEVLKLVAKGNSNKEIADHLSISLHTVISHRKNICRKLEIKTISGLTLYALINNLIS